MPLYEFGCEKCKTVKEVLQKYDDPAPSCSECSGETRRLISRTSFELKGDGWARDSYGKYDITYGNNGGGRGMDPSKINRDVSAFKG